MNVKTNVKAGGGTLNHSEALVVKTNVKAGGSINHNQAIIR